MRTLTHTALIALAAIATACHTAVGTTIELTSPQDATLTVHIHLEGEAASALDDDLKRQLDDLAATHLPEPARTTSPNRYTITSPIDYPTLQSTAPLTGIGALTLTPDPERTTHTTLDIAYTTPHALIDAITTELANQPDTDPLTAAMLTTTYIETTITFPGGIEQADDPHTGTLNLDETTATYRQPLHTFTPTTLTLTGDTKPPPSPLWVAPLLLALPLAAWRLTRTPASPGN